MIQCSGDDLQSPQVTVSSQLGHQVCNIPILTPATSSTRSEEALQALPAKVEELKANELFLKNTIVSLSHKHPGQHAIYSRVQNSKVA